LKDCQSLCDSVRQTLHEFFGAAKIEGVSLSDTLSWLVFELYRSPADRPKSWHLATDPSVEDWSGVDLVHSAMHADFTFTSRSSGRTLYLTDILRLHEKIDEETGAGGIVGHLLSAVEQITLFHVMRLIHRHQPSALARCVFLRDGPLAFFGQTANLHAPFRRALEWMKQSTSINLIGLEKSGAFVDHARLIQERIPRGSALILSDEYIFKHVIPKDLNSADVYGRNTYYGRKVIYRATGGGIHVATLPTAQALAAPRAADLQGFDASLACVDKLKCDMYDSALFPIALANKLVSLSAHPSQRILQRFATGAVRS
jgi:hypothetical protein